MAGDEERKKERKSVKKRISRNALGNCSTYYNMGGQPGTSL
jgi:hypothetical protein